MNAAGLALFESKLRGFAVRRLPPAVFVRLYSEGRLFFLKRYQAEKCVPRSVAARLARTCWGIRFRSPLLNAAGMFKNGESYALAAAQGAGAYLAGTTTAEPRRGNRRSGIRLPFSPYPQSGAASNWLGLPNNGDEAVARRLKELQRIPGCPVGASVMGSPELPGQERLSRLVAGLRVYAEQGIDFLELNESCPNTAHGKPQDDELRFRLEYIAEEFLVRRSPAGRPPVIVKFSNDTPLEQVPDLLKLLIELGFDGVNLGNTSTDYGRHRLAISDAEQGLYDYFTSTFGGGVSGRPLKQDSLALLRCASAYLREFPPKQEFHLIRTGGIENAEDVRLSLEAGASLVEWYTGYFENFAVHAHSVYESLYRGLL
jgi:dihydroorotate dehydrogenase